MINPDAMIFHHNPPYKRIDVMHVGRPRVVKLEDVQNDVTREPDSAIYKYDWEAEGISDV